MSPDKTRRLFDAFPGIFRDKDADMRNTAMCWGFECGDGWFEIIWSLCTELEKLGEDIVASQVKEKLGGLRFYIQGGSDAAYALISKATKESVKTCEQCGKPGRSHGTEWIWTECETCQAKRTLKA